jgi:hypothetical protein
LDDFGSTRQVSDFFAPGNPLVRNPTTSAATIPP